jgi:hypothetical protein
MNIRFTAGVCGMTLAIAGGTAALAQAPEATIRPYFAIRTVETVNDNGRSKTDSYSLEERDSSGRRLSAHLDTPDQRGKLTHATIWDPVKVRTIDINYLAHTATVTQFPATAADKLLPPSQPFSADDSNHNDLGEKMLGDLKVNGYVWTTNDPNAGMGPVASPAAGVPAVTSFSATAYPVTHESWWSPVLRLFLLSTTRDGNGNEQIIRYDQIQLKEPTAEDFAIPAGFAVRMIGTKPAGR